MTTLSTYLFCEIFSQLGMFAQIPFQSFIERFSPPSLYNRYITKNYISKIDYQKVQCNLKFVTINPYSHCIWYSFQKYHFLISNWSLIISN